MEYIHETALSRKALVEHFEQERFEWLAEGMTEADIFLIHFGEESENGHGGDYRVWLDENEAVRPDRSKYAPGAPAAISAVDPNGVWISGGHGGIDDVEFYADLKLALSTLTEKQRHCFVEVEIKGRKQKELAEGMSVSQQMVGAHIFSAKKKLKKFFSGTL